jgi:hypothetical protein
MNHIARIVEELNLHPINRHIVNFSVIMLFFAIGIILGTSGSSQQHGSKALCIMFAETIPHLILFVYIVVFPQFFIKVVSIVMQIALTLFKLMPVSLDLNDQLFTVATEIVTVAYLGTLPVLVGYVYQYKFGKRKKM